MLQFRIFVSKNIMKYSYILLLLFIFCKKNSNLEDNQFFEEISVRKQNIFIIDIGDDDYSYMGGRLRFRENLIKMVDRIKKLKPSVIYINNSFLIFDKRDEKLFSEKLNRGLATISTFDLNGSEKEENFTDEVKGQIGKIIKGKFNDYDGEYYGFNGISFPPIEIINKSKAICSSKYYLNEKNQVEFIYPYNRYENYLFENCPFTVVNEFLNLYQLKVALDENEGRIALYMRKNGRMKKIKYLKNETKNEHNVMTIKFSKFRKLSGKEFLENDGIRVDPGYIFIVNPLDISFKVSGDKSAPNSEVFASMVYTLLDLVSQKEFW